MSNDLVTPDNLSKEVLRDLYDAAIMSTSFDDDGDLKVSDGGSLQGEALYEGPVIPSRSMRIRLYAHTFETGKADQFKVDYVRLTALP